MQDTIRREEYKYYIGHSDLAHVEMALRSLMQLDPFCKNARGFYSVKSLYFDTPNSNDLDEKVDGIIEREKYRIRTYPNSNKASYKLEKKIKIDTVIKKTSLNISKTNTLNFQRSNFNDLLKIKDQFANQCYATFNTKGYRPVVIVEYDRQAFVLPYFNIRITIDQNLRTGNGQQDLTDNGYPCSQVFLDRMAILEVKFERYLPTFIQNFLSKFALKRSAISKFALCQVNTSNRPWTDPLNRPF